LSRPAGISIGSLPCFVVSCVNAFPRPARRFIVRRRTKEYQYRSNANSFNRINEKGKRKEYHTDDPGGEGFEIIKEVMACSDCAAKI
jgi:hypothetical protein